MGNDTLEELRQIVVKYKERWFQFEEDDARSDEFIGDLLNELEDIYNPSRLSGN